MAENSEPEEGRQRYLYRMLRYAPNTTNDEFYNIGVVLYDVDGRLIDARFTPDFRRMRCNPLVDVDDLRRIRDEFEDRRLLGEDFSGYVEGLVRDVSNSIAVSDMKSGACQDLEREIERLVEERLATQEGPADGGDPDRRPGGRRAVRMRATEAFARQGLFRNGHGVQRDVRVEYGRSGLAFVFDFEYERPSKEQRFVHAMGLRAPDELAGRLCFILQEYRSRTRSEAGLTVVAEDALGDDVRDLLAGHGIGTVGLSAIDGYAASIRGELGL